MNDTTIQPSQALAFTVPLLPGKTETDRREMTACASGERRSEHSASRRRLGITREAVWLQQTPQGDSVTVYLEADDLERAIAGMSTSDEPFDVWFREHLLDVHGVDLREGFPPPEQILDYRG